MIDALARDFVPVAANTRELQHRDREKDELGRFFWKIADQGHWRDQPGDTTQGLYAFSAAGDFYGFLNDRDVDAVLALLAKAKRAFAEKKPKKLELARPAPDPSVAPPEGAAVARAFARISPLPEGLAAGDRNRGVGRDHLWIPAAEVAAIARELVQHERCLAPASLLRRIVRYHLVDDVRGEPDRWRSSEVVSAKLDVVRAAATTKNHILRARLEGSFAMKAAAGKKSEDGRTLGERGYEGTLEGTLEIDLATVRLAAFELLAEGRAWGEGQFTPAPPPGKFPLKIAFVLAHAGKQGEKLPPGIVSPEGLDDGRETYLSPPDSDD